MLFYLEEMDIASEDRIKVACRIRPGESNLAQTCTRRCVTVDKQTHSVTVNSKPGIYKIL